MSHRTLQGRLAVLSLETPNSFNHPNQVLLAASLTLLVFVVTVAPWLLAGKCCYQVSLNLGARHVHHY